MVVWEDIHIVTTERSSNSTQERADIISNRSSGPSRRASGNDIDISDVDVIDVLTDDFGPDIFRISWLF